MGERRERHKCMKGTKEEVGQGIKTQNKSGIFKESTAWRRLGKQSWNVWHKRKRNIGKVYSLEHNDIEKVFFMPHHIGCCCNDVTHGHCCVFGHSCTVFPVMKIKYLTWKHPSHAGLVPCVNNDHRPWRLSIPIGTVATPPCRLSIPLGTMTGRRRQCFYREYSICTDPTPTPGHAGWVLPIGMMTSHPSQAGWVLPYKQWPPALQVDCTCRNNDPPPTH